MVAGGDEALRLSEDLPLGFEVLLFAGIAFGVRFATGAEEHILCGPELRPQSVVVSTTGAGGGFPLGHQVAVGAARRTPVGGVRQLSRAAYQVLFGLDRLGPGCVEFREMLPAGLVELRTTGTETLPLSLFGSLVEPGQ